MVKGWTLTSILSRELSNPREVTMARLASFWGEMANCLLPLPPEDGALSEAKAGRDYYELAR